MADVFKGLTIKLGVEAAGLSKGLNQARREARQTAKELKQVEKAMKFDPQNAALAARQIELMQTRIRAASNELKVYKELESSIGKDGMTGEEWTWLQSQIVMAEGKLKSFNNELAKTYIEQDAAKSMLGKAGASLEQWGKKYGSIGTGLQNVGGALTRTLTPAIIAAGAASVSTAVDIDTSLTNVKKTVDGTEEDYQRLKDAAIEFSKTNAVSATEILDIQSLGAQLGFAIDELDEFSRVVSGLDIATNMDAETAATELAQFANITKMSHDDVSNYGSAIVALGNNFATTESDVSAMAMRLAAAGTQVGMSQADILGLAAALTSMGLEAEAGGTAMSTVISNIDTSVAENSASLETWASAAGMSADQFAAAWKSDPVDALAAVLSGMEQAVNEGGNMSLMLDELGVSSLRQTDTMKRLAGNSELVADAVRLSNDAWRENTALQSEVDNRNDSLAAKFEMLGNRLTAIADRVGGPLAEALLDIVDAAEPLVQAVEDGAQAFADMSEQEQQAVLAAVGVAAALGPMLTLLGKGVSSVEPLGKAMQKLAEWFAKVGGAGKQATSALGSVGDAGTKAEGGIRKSSVALGALKATLAGLGISLAVAAIAALADAFVKASENASNYEKATSGLKDAFGELFDSSEKASESLGKLDGSNVTRTYSEVRDAVQDAAREQAEFADQMSQVFSEASGKVASLQGYYDVIDKLYGRTDLTAHQQDELRNAIQRVGDQIGISLSMGTDAGGAYVAMGDGAIYAKDAILELIRTQQLQYQFDAIESQMEDAYSNRSKQVDTLKDAYDNLTTAQENYDNCTRDQFTTYREWSESQEGFRNKLNNAIETYRQQVAQYDEANATVERLTDSQILLNSAIEEGASSVDFAVATNDILMGSLKEQGATALDLATDLQNAGVSVDDFSNLSTDAVLQIASAYDGSFSSIQGILEQHSVAMDQAKVATVNTADAIEQSFSTLGPELQTAIADAGISLSDLALGLAQAGVSMDEFASLTPQQMAQVASAFEEGIGSAIEKMEGFTGKTYSEGTQAGQAWYSGFSESTMAAAEAAANMAGVTLEQFWASVPEYAQASEEAVNQYISSLSTSDGSGGQSLAQTEADAASNSAAWDGSGTGAVQAYEEPLTSSTGEGGNALAQSNAQAAATHTGEYTAAAEPAKQAYQTALSSSDGAGGMQLAQNNINAASAKSGEYQSAAQSAVDSYQSALSSSDGSGGQQLAQANIDGINGLTDEFTSAGTTQGEAYASGVQAADGFSAGASLAQAADSGARSVDGSGAGANFGAGFVAGVRSYIGEAMAAAASLVNAAKSAADSAAQSHSPSRVMMQRGVWFGQGFVLGMEETYGDAGDGGAALVASAVKSVTGQVDRSDLSRDGVHLTENFARGIVDALPQVTKASEAIAKEVYDYIGHSEPAKGPLSEGEWVFGVHTATNYAAGLSSGKAKVKQAAADIAETVSDSFSSASSSAASAGSDAGDAAMNAYINSMIANYKSRSYEIKEPATELADAIWGTAMPAIEALGYDVPGKGPQKYLDELKEGIGGATSWSNELGALFSKTGVIYTQEFVEKICDGSEEGLEAIQELSQMSEPELQAMVDGYTDLTRAEREQEIAQRSLWVNSLATLNSQGKNAKDWLLDFRETCLDVKEALATEQGLKGAFSVAGISIEEFAFELNGLDVTMDDFRSNVADFVADVTNGFDQMTKYNQTTFAEWEKNLRLNMAESQAYAENVTAVFNSIPENIDSSAFRKAVYEGGFAQWGQVMEDMAQKSAEEIAAAVELYNEAIMEAQQSAIEQFVAISPGEELAQQTIEGIKAMQNDVNASGEDMSTEAADAIMATVPDWESTGGALAQGVATGIMAQAASVAQAAAQMVTEALNAANEAAAVASPSKETEYIGKMMGKGLGMGLLDQSDYVARQARSLANIPLDQLRASQTVNTVNNTNNSSVTWNVTVRNDEDLRTLMRKFNREQDGYARARGYR